MKYPRPWPGGMTRHFSPRHLSSGAPAPLGMAPNRGFGNRRRQGVVLLALGVLGTGAVVAQAQEGPVVLGPQERPPVLSLDPFHGSLGMDSIYSNNSSTSGGQKTTATDTLLQQKLTLATGGSIVSKNLFEWHSSGTVGVTEEWYRSGPDHQNTLGQLYLFDVDGTILKNTDYPVNIFARRNQNFEDRSFAPLLENTITTYGGMANYRGANMPSTLRIYQTETVQKELGGAPQYQITEQHLDLHTQFSPMDRHFLTLGYQYATVSESTPGRFNDNYNTQSAQATHSWSLDGDGRYTLTQSVNYNQQTGQYANDHLQLDEYLKMRHTDTFETYLEYNLDKQSYTNSSTDTNRINGGFSHRLFESLTTSGAASYTNLDRVLSGEGGGDSSTQTYFDNLGLNYNKKVPLGQLSANFSYSYTKTDNGAVGATQQVFGDPAVFVDPLPIVLTRPYIDSNTIAVFNANRTRRYTAGTDYQVKQVGNTIQIQRQVGGNINQDQVVSLDYDVDPIPGYTFATNAFGTGVRYDFQEGLLNGLGLYVQYYQQDQTIASAGPINILPDNIHDTLLGVEYRFWKLTLRVEEEFHDSTVTPYDATRLSAQYLERLGDRTNLSFSAYQTMIHYPVNGADPGGQTNFTSLEGRIDYQIDRNLQFQFASRWRNDEDSRFGHTMGFEEEPQLHWRFRQMTLYILARYSYLNTTGEITQDLLVQTGVTREF